MPTERNDLSTMNRAPQLDIYTWLAHRLHRLPKRGQSVYWSNLKAQFGAEYNSLKDFKKTFKAALARTQSVYPDARIDSITGGLRLLPSAPPINNPKIKPFL